MILAVTDARNEHPALAPLAIGLTLTMIHFASITATGTSVNPARSIGVGLFAGGDAIIQLWLFILAPLVGAAIAGITYPLIFGHGTDPVAGSGLNFAPARAGRGARLRRARPVPAGVEPAADRPGPGARGSRSRSSRTAGSGTTPLRSGSPWSSGSPAPPAQAAPAPTPPAQTDADAGTPPAQPSPRPQQPPQPDPGTETTQLRPPE